MTRLPRYAFEIVNSFPHDPSAFTQGLIFDEGGLFESTGNYGSSSLRRVALETGAVEQRVSLAPALFGEGIALWRDSLIQLTWRSGIALVVDKRSFEPRRSYRYRGEGWGLACDGQQFVMSDGSATLCFRDPESFEITGRRIVRAQGRPVGGLNELQLVRGELFANVWPRSEIARIDLATGVVTGWIDLDGLIDPAEIGDPFDDVLNGIAYDADRDRLFVTGKRWPRLFEIRVVAAGA